jgi:hypothetical protein
LQVDEKPMQQQQQAESKYQNVRENRQGISNLDPEEAGPAIYYPLDRHASSREYEQMGTRVVEFYVYGLYGCTNTVSGVFYFPTIYFQ